MAAMDLLETHFHPNYSVAYMLSGIKAMTISLCLLFYICIYSDLSSAIAFSVKGQIVNILGFLVSVATAQLFHYSMKRAIENM